MHAFYRFAFELCFERRREAIDDETKNGYGDGVSGVLRKDGLELTEDLVVLIEKLRIGVVGARRNGV